MRKFTATLLCVAMLCFCTAGCGDKQSGDSGKKDDGYIELLGDPKFEAGINIDSTGFGNDVGGREFADYMGRAHGDVYWSYAQHNCNLSTRNGNEYKDGDYYVYTDNKDDSEVSKKLKVNPTAGSVVLDCDASKDYEGPRTKGTDPWVHMLLGQGFYDETFVCDMDELILDISFTLTKMENLMGDAYNPSLHAAQFQLFFVVKSANPAENNAGLWFGMPFFDNRETELTAPNGGFDRGTNMYISSMGNAAYMSELATVGKKVTIKHDLKAEIKTALENAQKLGYMQSTTFEDLYLVNMNIGWEIPGIFDAGVEIHNFNLKAKRAEA